MSAIFGIFNFDGSPPEISELEAVGEVLSSRGWGPEGRVHQVSGGAGLGHALSLETEEHRFEKQPIVRDGLVSVADARLNNLEELTAELGLSPEKARKLPDSEFVFRAFQRWGSDCPKRLDGAFAFVVWDIEERTLFCARDHIGFRPFYFSEGAGRFIFASDRSAILALEGVSEDVDDDVLMLETMALPLPGDMQERTSFRLIRRLLPGRHLTVSESGVARTRYWPPPRVDLGIRTEAELGERVRTVVEEAVRRQLRRADTGLGSHLSGGLDSSIVSVLAARLTRAEGDSMRHVFSWSPSFSDFQRLPEDDERDRIEAICQRENLQCHYISPEQSRMQEFFDTRDLHVEPRIVWLHELKGGPLARDLGIGVVLSGFGGDEGITSHRSSEISWELAARGNWISLWKETAATCESRRAAAILSECIRRPLRHWKSYFHSAGLPSLIEPIQGELTAAELAVFHRFMRWLRRPRLSYRARQLQRLSQTVHRLEASALLETQTGISYRFPLLDRKVLELALSIPARFHVSGGKARFPFLSGFKDLVDDEIASGRKIREPVREQFQKPRALAIRDTPDPKGDERLNRWFLLRFQSMKELLENKSS